MKVLDCTLRDGGYYNNWDFDESVVLAYLQAVANANIDYVELGLRNFPKQGFLGAFAYTTEAFLASIDLPDGPTYGVMVDAKTILTSGLDIIEAVDKLFVEQNTSKVQLVRVAAHFAEVEKSEAIVKRLKAKGYIVGLNLMQAGGKPSETIANLAKVVSTWGALDVLYFADSLGNMDSAEVDRIITALRLGWTGELGIHTHNNMGQGLSNSKYAWEHGVNWIDSTITGMGRGAGNTQTESLLATLDSLGSSSYTSKPIFDLAIRHFEPMQKVYGWGSNLLYFLGAQNDIHPTYIQNLLGDSHFGTDEVIGAIDYLSRLENSASYSNEQFHNALSFGNANKPLEGSKDLVGIASEREVLILANGPSLNRYKKDVVSYIQSNRPIVLALNVIDFPEEFIDFYCASRNSKFLSESEQYQSLSRPIILPLNRFTDEEIDTTLSSSTILNYGLEVSDEKLQVDEEYCVTPHDLTAVYSFCAASVMNPSRISLVGFDGYTPHDPRQLEMIEIFNLVKDKLPELEFRAITPSTYPISKYSLYAPY